MWVFGYGSLMWDGWEDAYGCLHRTPAELAGHSRIFNKKSIKRWGTRVHPGPTLNLSPGGTCPGMAFEFDDDATPDIVAYLDKREACTATELPVRLADETEVPALVYIYDGPRLIDGGLSLEERAAMILAAQGTAGSGFDYIKGVCAHLAGLGVADTAVDELWYAVAALKERRDD